PRAGGVRAAADPRADHHALDLHAHGAGIPHALHRLAGAVLPVGADSGRAAIAEEVAPSRRRGPETRDLKPKNGTNGRTRRPKAGLLHVDRINVRAGLKVSEVSRLSSLVSSLFCLVPRPVRRIRRGE